MGDFIPGRSPSDKPSPVGSSSFPVFCSKVAGVVVAVSVAALIFDAEPEIKEMAKIALKYAIVCWAIFAGIPYLLRAPKEIMKRAGTILKYVLLTIAFPFAIRMILNNRAEWRSALSKFLQEKFGLSLPDPPSVKVDTAQPEPTSGAAMPPSPAPSPLPDVLPAPFNMLPYNPNPVAFSEINESNASERLSTAIQMAGLSVEGEIEVISIKNGPTLQTIAFRLPPKLQLSTLTRKRDDLGNHFGHQQGFDIVATEYQSSAAFVIPNKQRADVYVRDVAVDFLEYAKKAELPMILGKDTQGNPKFADIAKFPHLLVAGSTGSGKSVGLNTAISSLISVRSPDEVKLLLIDPKMVELSVYRGLPHLITPPITDFKRVIFYLHKAIAEMEKRYELFAAAGVRNLLQYNRKMEQTGGKKLPYHVIFIDEYGDLMLVIGTEVSEAVQRLGQKARAAGINMVLTTQRPSTDVVTGVIKANLPSRLAFRVSSTTDYYVIMDTTGPNLLGRGDGMFSLNGAPQERFQSATIGNEEESVKYAEDLVRYWKGRSGAMDPVSLEKTDPERDYEAAVEENGGQLALDLPELDDEDQEFDPADDELLPRAIELAKDPEIIFTVTLLQRKLRIGYTRAKRIVEYMEQQDWIGKHDPDRPGREWLGGDSDESVLGERADDSLDYAIQDQVLDEYGQFCRIIQEHGGFSMSLISKQLQLDASTAAKYVERMVKDGLLGEFDTGKGMRPYIGKLPIAAADSAVQTDEQVEKIREYICRTRSAKTGEIRDLFQMRKEDVILIYKKLVEEGFLNEYTSKKEGYTIAWSDRQIEEYLQQKKHEEEEEVK